MIMAVKLHQTPLKGIKWYSLDDIAPIPGYSCFVKLKDDTIGAAYYFPSVTGNFFIRYKGEDIVTWAYIDRTVDDDFEQKAKA